LVDLPEGMLGDKPVPGDVGALLELVVVAEVGGVVVMLNEVEVAAHDEVHVVWNADQQFELLGATAVVVVAGGQVHVKESKGERGVAISCPTLKA
jgi:hypothetical protein